jgi:hypothetical protein
LPCRQRTAKKQNNEGQGEGLHRNTLPGLLAFEPTGAGPGDDSATCWGIIERLQSTAAQTPAPRSPRKRS